MDVRGGVNTGGLAGFNGLVIVGCSVTGAVSGFGDAGGLVGSNFADQGAAIDSYWNAQTSGQSGSAGGEGKTTSELQSPTGYTGIYEDWNADLDEDELAMTFGISATQASIQR